MIPHVMWKIWALGLSVTTKTSAPGLVFSCCAHQAMFFTRHGRQWPNLISSVLQCRWGGRICTFSPHWFGGKLKISLWKHYPLYTYVHFTLLHHCRYSHYGLTSTSAVQCYCASWQWMESTCSSLGLHWDSQKRWAGNIKICTVFLRISMLNRGPWEMW